MAGPSAAITSYFLPVGSWRASVIDDLQARLEHLAFAPRLDGQDRPPLVTYTTTPTAHGDVVSATPAYREWFLRAYPAAGREDCARLPAPGPSVEGVGGENAVTPTKRKHTLFA